MARSYLCEAIHASIQARHGIVSPASGRPRMRSAPEFLCVRPVGYSAYSASTHPHRLTPSADLSMATSFAPAPAMSAAVWTSFPHGRSPAMSFVSAHPDNVSGRTDDDRGRADVVGRSGASSTGRRSKSAPVPTVLHEAWGKRIRVFRASGGAEERRRSSPATTGVWGTTRCGGPTFPSHRGFVVTPWIRGRREAGPRGPAGAGRDRWDPRASPRTSARDPCCSLLRQTANGRAVVGGARLYSGPSVNATARPG